MSSELRVECPGCHTSYLGTRCGLAANQQHATIACLVCKVAFECHIAVTTTAAPSAPWWKVWGEVSDPETKVTVTTHVR